MIKINGKDFLAEHAVEVVRQNTVPVQQVEKGFDVQDHIESLPLQLELQLVLYDNNTDDIWSEDSYEHLRELYESKRLAKVDCSNYAETDGDGAPRSLGKKTVMIYENMAMTYLGQVVQRGNVYFCTAKFTHITKTVVKSQTLYIQEAKFETDENGNPIETRGVRWSRADFEPTTVASAEGDVIDMADKINSGLALPIPAIPRSTITQPINTISNVMSGIWGWVDDIFIEPYRE